MKSGGIHRIKGEYGDRARLKRSMIIGAAAILVFIAALVVIGYLRFGTRKNILTVLAILAVLPFANIASVLSTLLPYPSLTKAQAERLGELADGLETVYDVVFTTSKSAIPIDCLVIEEGRLLALSPVPDKKIKLLTDSLKDFYKAHGYKHMALVIEKDYDAFVSKLETMAHKDTKNRRTAELRKEFLVNCV